MKRITVLLCALLCITLLNAQRSSNRGERSSSKKIEGIVFDSESDIPLEFATLSLYNKKDDQLVGGGITDKDGKFEIAVRPGSYLLKIEFISYATREIDNITVNPGDEIVDLNQIKLGIDSEQLDEVVISERRSQVQLSLDKKVFNVGRDLTNKGGTAEDILNNVPSVEVDLEGGVTLRGSGGVRILIDGKPSMMVGEGNANGLRNLPSNMIEKVEVITNPGARYEAEGMAGIINIVLKKDRKKGFNGSFDFTGGFPLLAGTAFNLNYRREKVNLFSSIGVRQRTGPGGGFSNQETRYLDGTSDIFNSTRTINRSGLSGNVSLGMDYFIDNNNIITSSFSFRRSLENNNNKVVYEDFEGSRSNLVSITERFDDEGENEFDTEYALTYEKKFKGKDHKFLADFRFQDNTEIEGSDFREVYFDAFSNPTGSEDLLQNSSNEEGERRYNLKIDYNRPLPNQGTFEAGGQSSFRTIGNDFQVQERIDDEWVRLANLSNDFRYDEFINAAYGIYSKELTRWSYQVGLRAEYSNVVTELLESDLGPNDRSYLNLFPSAFLSFKLDETNSFQVSYSRRIRRPRFWDLNPFFTFSDPRNQFAGNPDLDPEFTNSYEAGYVKYFENGSVTSSIYYRRTNNEIQRVLQVTADSVNLRRPENLTSSDNFGFEFTGSYKIQKWWSLNGNLNLFRQIVNGGNINQDFQADTYSWFTRLNNRFNFSKTLEGQLRLNYRAPRQTTQGSTRGIGSVDLGLGKEFPKQNMTLTLNVRDLFNSRKRNGISEFDLFDDNGDLFGTFYSESEFQWRARQVTLALNYRINQDKKRGRDRRGGGNYEGGGEEGF